MNGRSTNDDKSPVIVEFPGGETVQAQAARWLAVLDADHVPEEKLAEFRRWINEDDSHRAEFESLVSFWDDLNILTRVTPPQERSAMDRASEPRSHWSGWRQRLAGLVVASLVAVAIIVIRAGDNTAEQTYTTAVGEQKTIELPDNSTVVLNTNSRIAVEFGDERRGIRLVQGEALFDVRRDPRRPFEVYVGDRTVRAVGTAFSVRLKREDIEVLVTEGVVEIDRALAAARPDSDPAVAGDKPLVGAGEAPPAVPTDGELAPHRIRVPAGRQAIVGFDDARQVLVAEIEKMEEKLSWRTGMLTFDREPLENVVAEVSRYTTLRFIIPEKQVREMVVGGVFKVGDTESLFEALQLGFGIRAEEVADNVVYLSLANDGG